MGRSETKRGKNGRANSEAVNNIADGDRISYLPNDILLQILSFLPTEEAIKTTVLSSKWRNLWTSLTTLHLDYRLLYGYSLEFVDYFNNVFLLRDNNLPIHEFNLRSCDRYCYRDSYTITWICAAINQGVQHLNFKYQSEIEPHFRLPWRFYGCRTLVSLELAGDILIDLSFVNLKSSTFLPSLKILCLRDIKFYDDESVAKLISSCQVLEELVIQRQIGDGAQKICVCAPKLKRLTWQCLTDYKRLKGLKYTVMVSAPSLEYLYVEDEKSNDVVLETSSSLVQAKLVLPSYEPRYDHDYWRKIIKVVSNVKCLYMCKDHIECPVGVTYNDLPIFQNLTSLELRVQPGEFEWMNQLYENAPNLKHFVLDLTWRGDVGGPYWRSWRPPHSVPSCFLTCLESVKITLLGRLVPAELMDLFKYFLKNAKILKKMEIFHDPGKAEPSFINELLMFPRVSKACQVQFKVS